MLKNCLLQLEKLLALTPSYSPRSGGSYLHGELQEGIRKACGAEVQQ